MATKRFCDRCSREISFQPSFILSGMSYPDQIQMTPSDLCKSCGDDLARWLKSYVTAAKPSGSQP